MHGGPEGGAGGHGGGEALHVRRAGGKVLKVLVVVLVQVVVVVEEEHALLVLSEAGRDRSLRHSGSSSSRWRREWKVGILFRLHFRNNVVLAAAPPAPGVSVHLEPVQPRQVDAPGQPAGLAPLPRLGPDQAPLAKVWQAAVLALLALERPWRVQPSPDAAAEEDPAAVAGPAAVVDVVAGLTVLADGTGADAFESILTGVLVGMLLEDIWTELGLIAVFN